MCLLKEQEKGINSSTQPSCKEYYLMCCAASFQARRTKLWQCFGNILSWTHRWMYPTETNIVPGWSLREYLITFRILVTSSYI